MLLRARRLLARFRRFDQVQVDELLALALLVEIELQVWLSPYVHDRVPSAVGGLALSAAVAVRRRWPFGAVLVAVVAVMAQEALGGRVTQHTVGALLALILVMYSAGALLGERRAWLALGLGLAGLSASVGMSAGTFSDLWFGGIFLEGLPWAVGRIGHERSVRERAYRERAERVDAGREQHELAAVWGERARIARELHDVIAHSVSVMVLQASGARMVMGAEPERAEVSLCSVERAGRDALAEMRRLLGVLGSGEDLQSLAPQPGLRDIEDLIVRTRSAGLSTYLRVDGEPMTVSAALDLCAYRIVQEALTNAIKHAGPAHAEVRLRWEHDALEVEISDNGCGSVDVNGASGGHGIAGMRERAVLYGGTLDAGPGPGRGFTVHAHLPLSRERVR
ncbi:MAG: sensor histidine kinase [Actinomycetota bacterium]|nr:sensor histidine kinase [Actinomycetota bacterium]